MAAKPPIQTFLNPVVGVIGQDVTVEATQVIVATPPADQTQGQSKKQHTIFKRKYTLIDNFDKLDLAYAPTRVSNLTGGPVGPGQAEVWHAQLSDPASIQDTFQLGVELPGHKGYRTYRDRSETLQEFKDLTAPELVTFLVDATETLFANFQRPLAYRWDVRPDLLRFLTSRRFYLNDSGELLYPSPEKFLYTKDSSVYPAKSPPAASRTPAKPWGFVIDIAANIASKLNVNFNATKSQILFSQYLSAEGEYGPNGEAVYLGDGRPVDETNVLLKLSQLSTVLDSYKSAKNESGDDARRLLLNLTKPGSGLPLVPKKYSDTSEEGINDPLGAHVGELNTVDVFTDWGTMPNILLELDEPTIATGWQISADDMQEIFNLISRLTSFSYSSGDVHYSVDHYYFVADFPFGEVTRLGADLEDQYTVNTDILDFTPFYNFYSRAVTEKISSNAMTSERQLPNIYTFYAFKANLSSDTAVTYYNNLLTLGAAPLVSKKSFKISDYYDLAQNVADAPTLDRYKKIVFGKDLSILKDVKSLKSSFPYGVQIDLPTTHRSDLAETLKETDLIDSFTTLLANYSIDVGSEVSSIHRFIIHNNKFAELGGRGTVDLTDLQIFDLNAFYEELKDPINQYTPYFNVHSCVSFGHIFAPPDAAGFGPMFSSEFNEIKGALNQYFNEKYLNIAQMYAGEKCHREILVWEIAKFRITGDGTKELIQSIFIPNLVDSGDVYSYLDTQVIPHREYVYEIFTHTLVIGTKYNLPKGQLHGVAGLGGGDYKWNAGWDVASIDDSQGEVIRLNTTPSPPFAMFSNAQGKASSGAYAIIIRAPYYNTETLLLGKIGRTTTVMSKPPLPPDLSFYPYKDADNKVLVLLNQNFGMKILPPISVHISDQANINAQMTAQQYESKPPGQLIYKNDDGRGHWEIYRTTEKPLSYSDFKDIAPTIINVGDSSGYNDKILKNTDYYYMARFIDIHGNISNPTNIFYLRVIREEGFPPYLDLKDYNISEFGYDMVSVPFKKFLKIKLKDFVRNVVGNGMLSDAKISYDAGVPDALQKYKFRITSKKTAKVIDINVDFKKKIVMHPNVVTNALDPHPQTEAQKVTVTAAENKNVGPPLPTIDSTTHLGNLGFDVSDDEAPNC
jgi:hypothetical protein